MLDISNYEIVVSVTPLSCLESNNAWNTMYLL